MLSWITDKNWTVIILIRGWLLVTFGIPQQGVIRRICYAGLNAGNEWHTINLPAFHLFWWSIAVLSHCVLTACGKTSLPHWQFFPTDSHSSAALLLQSAQSSSDDEKLSLFRCLKWRNYEWIQLPLQGIESTIIVRTSARCSWRNSKV